MFLPITFLLLAFIGLGLVLYSLKTSSDFTRGLGTGICIPVLIRAIYVLIS